MERVSGLLVLVLVLVLLALLLVPVISALAMLGRYSTFDPGRSAREASAWRKVLHTPRNIIDVRWGGDAPFWTHCALRCVEKGFPGGVGDGTPFVYIYFRPHDCVFCFIYSAVLYCSVLAVLLSPALQTISHNRSFWLQRTFKMLAFRSASRSVAAPIRQWGLGSRAFSDVPTKKKTIQQLAKEISLKNQPVLVRADLNLPRSKEDGSIVDDTRARAVSV